MDDRIRQIIGSSKNKVSVNSDTNINLSLESKERLIKDNANQITRIISEDDQFSLERDSSWLYRLSGRLNIITSNRLTPDACDDVWDPLLTKYGNTSSPNNWVLQLCYPSKKDYDYDLWDGYSVSYGMLVESISRSEKDNNRYRVVVKTKQKHSLQVGDYIHLNYISGGNTYNGIHKIEKLGGENGVDVEYSFTLETTYDQNKDNTGFIFVKRFVNPTDNDFNGVNIRDINTTLITDINGTNNGDEYLTITTPTPHGLGFNGFIEIVSDVTNRWKGLHRVVNVISEYKFVIKSIENTSPVNIKYRRLDGTPSEYYMREFSIISVNDYEVYKGGFSSSIYSDTSDHKIGTANDTWLFHFNNDINLANLISHKDGFVDELYFCMMKRAGEKNYNFTDVTSHWDFKVKEGNLSNKIQTISNRVIGSLGTIKSGNYIADIVEYNRYEIMEKVISKVNFRFTTDVTNDENGYYYDPFRRLYTRRFSINRETYPNKDEIEGVSSNYEIYPDNSIGWRDLLPNGVFEDGDNGVDYPFVNNRHYIYDNFIFYIRQQQPIPDEIIDQDSVITIDANFRC